jgi:cell division protein ZapA (FtsZ GTPase activity inhibitor)
MSKGSLLLSSLLILLSTNVMAEDDALNNKINQLKQLLNEVPAALSQKINTSVLLGSDQTLQAMPNAMLEQGAKEIIKMIDVANQIKAKDSIAGLSWIQSDSSTAPSTKLFNAGQSGEVNICRAPFLGNRGLGKAIYPGLLTSHGCLISYAGYAFTVAKYDVLAGSNPDLKWIPYQTVIAEQEKNMQQAKSEPQKAGNICVQGQCYSNPAMYGLPMSLGSISEIKVNGASAVSGGYDNSGAVIICRTNYNNKETVGKLVGTVCDISSADKEISITKNFDLLYYGTANTQSANK